jgi:uncharacterized membrane protein
VIQGSIVAALRKWFLSGLLVLVPLGITFWVLNWVVSTLDLTLSILPEHWRPVYWLGMQIPGLGVIFALVVVLLIGALASNFIGNKLLGWWDGLLGRIPVVRSIYSSVKQVSDTLFSDKGNAFREAVLVQWPRPGMWTVAFVTAKPSLAAREAAPQDEFLCVYVPTTPNPTSGYMVFVRKDECKSLDLSVDEALTYVVSMGVVDPATSSKRHRNQQPLPLEPRV